jgi:hypothetical protein
VAAATACQAVSSGGDDGPQGDALASSRFVTCRFEADIIGQGGTLASSPSKHSIHLPLILPHLWPLPSSSPIPAGLEGAQGKQAGQGVETVEEQRLGF